MAKKLILQLQLFLSRVPDFTFVLLLGWSLFLLSPVWEILRFIFINSNSNLIHIARIILFSLIFFTRNIMAVCCGAILILWMLKYSFHEISLKQTRVLIYIFLTNLLFIAMTVFLFQVESKNYPNYLYSHFGITLQSLQAVNKISLIILGILLFFSFQQKNSKKILKQIQKQGFVQPRKRHNWQVYLGGIALILVVLSSSYPLTSLPEILASRNLTYPQRLGREYQYLLQIEKGTKKDQVIIHPPQLPQWPLIGNQPMVRYFLFPRKLISGSVITSQEVASTLQKAIFIDIKNDPAVSSWPVIDEKQNKISFDLEHSVNYQKLSKLHTDSGFTLYQVTFYE